MKLRYLLGTNICIYIAKQKPIQVLRRFEQVAVGEVAMSTITYGELLYGTQKSHNTKQAALVLEQLIHLIPPSPVPEEAGIHYGYLRSKLEKQGKLIGGNDLWIAAHAMALNVALVTNNLREFSRIPQLKLENWV